MPDAPTVTAMPRSPKAHSSGPTEASSPGRPALWRPLFSSWSSKDNDNNGVVEANSDNDSDNDSGNDNDNDNGSSTASTSSIPNNTAAEGSREVLIDRLQDLVRHLAAGKALSSPGAHVGARARRADDRVLSALHARVDDMEAVLAAAAAAAGAAAEAAAEAGADPALASPSLASSPLRHDRTRSSLSSLGTAASAAAAAVASSSSLALGSPMSSLRQRSAILERPAALLTGRKPSSSAAAVAAAAAAAHAEAKGSVFWGIPPQKKQETADESKRAEGKPTSQEPNRTKTLAVESARLDEELAAALARLTTTSRDAEAIQQSLMKELEATRDRAATLEVELAALRKLEQQMQQMQQTPKTPPAPVVPPRHTKEFVLQSPSVVSTAASTTTAAGSQLETIDSELSFLRLQLRAIELRCRALVPDETDPELAESIANWKADWAALRAQVDEEEHSLRQTMTGGSFYGYDAMYE